MRLLDKMYTEFLLCVTSVELKIHEPMLLISLLMTAVSYNIGHRMVKDLCVCMCMCVCMYVYVCVCVFTEKEKEWEWGERLFPDS